MKRRLRSIRNYLALVFAFFFLVVSLLGLFSMFNLRDVNRLSGETRDRWLPSTRSIGDLNNYTSDYRAAEGAYLLSSNPGALTEKLAEMKALEAPISQAQRDYEKIHHDAEESAIYAQWAAQWNGYKAIVRQELDTLKAGRKAMAISVFGTTSESTYNRSSDTLGRLTALTVARARNATVLEANAYRQAQWLIGIAGGVAALFVAGAVTYIRRQISDPLLDLAATIHRLAANETDVAIHGTERTDEIGEMARGVVVFRNNAIDLAVSRQGLVQQASMLSEKLAQEQQLTSRQREFVSMASHEFRTPLTIIDGQAQRMLALKEGLRPEQLVERLGKIRSAVLRMTSVMDRLLQSSRLGDGDTALYFHPAEIELTKLIRDCCQFHRELSPRRISENLPSTPLLITGDEKLLFQAFSNLLSNALKYSPPENPIDVSARHTPGQVTVTIADRGIGIPAGDIGHIFERYYRGSNVSGVVGTGVGLYFVKTVIELHRGSISVESKIDGGSEFAVTLARNVPPEPQHIAR